MPGSCASTVTTPGGVSSGRYQQAVRLCPHTHKTSLPMGALPWAHHPKLAVSHRLATGAVRRDRPFSHALHMPSLARLQRTGLSGSRFRAERNPRAPSPRALWRLVTLCGVLGVPLHETTAQPRPDRLRHAPPPSISAPPSRGKPTIEDLRAVRAVTEAVVVLDVEHPLPTARWQPRVPAQGGGSGMVLDSRSGWVLTNAHVVEGAARIRVRLRDGRTTGAVIRGIDRATDIAVLQMRPVLSGVSSVRFATPPEEQQLQPGSPIWAVGHPLGLTFTLSQGIVSAIGRSRELRALRGAEAGPIIQDFIQVDASVSPGSSGGPLMAENGAVVGMVTAVTGAPAGGSYGFAIPTSLLQEVVPALIADGTITRPVLGVQLLDPSPADMRMLGRSRVEGAWVATTPLPGTPAAMAGVVRGDLLLTMDNAPIRDASTFGRLLQTRGDHEAISLTVQRGDAIRQLRVNLREAERTAGAEATDWDLGSEVSASSTSEPYPPIWRLGLEVGEVSAGDSSSVVVIVEVAQRAELRNRLAPGDRIVAVRTRHGPWHPVRNRADVERRIQEASLDDAIGLQVLGPPDGRVREINLQVFGPPLAPP